MRGNIRQEILKFVPKGIVFSVERPENPEYGDYSSNIALVAAKVYGNPPAGGPREVAEELKFKIVKSPVFNNFVERIDIAGPGFLNFFIKKEYLQKSLAAVLKSDFGRVNIGDNKRVNVEFVSANPTGPLTMANGRGGFYGDALSNVLECAGYDVTREYYINDAGNQVKILGESILAAEGKLPRKEEYYRGEYIEKLKGKTAKQTIAAILKWIRASLKRAGIVFDVWFSEEKNLHQKGELKKMLAFLERKGLIEKKDGAVWLGDAVLVKSDGNPTYFLSDLAYHYDKFFMRKFDIAVDIWGADHHGYAARMQKGIAALGIGPERLKIIITQLVRLVSKGKEVRMSKRKGEFVTMDELIDSVGLDAARWFFLEKSPNTHMDFDLDLAKERSRKNPVYYVQYAHARACSILKKATSDKRQATRFLSLLDEAAELNLIKKLLQLPEIVEDVASDYQVQRLTKYVYELARAFTDFYENCRVIDGKNADLTAARLLLVSAARKTLKEVLEDLIGINAPQKM